MNTMEITKLVGAVCGSLLVFLLISTAAHMIFDTSSDVVAFSVPVEEETADASAEDAAPAEEVDVAALVAAADPAAGEAIFKRCSACHKLAEGENAVGPYLHGLVGRDIASIEGFKYSAALSGLEGNWDEAQIYSFLENPKTYAPGTAMAFAGLAKSEDRANVIAYIEAQSN